MFNTALHVGVHLPVPYCRGDWLGDLQKNHRKHCPEARISTPPRACLWCTWVRIRPIKVVRKKQGVKCLRLRSFKTGKSIPGPSNGCPKDPTLLNGCPMRCPLGTHWMVQVRIFPRFGGDHPNLESKTSKTRATTSVCSCTVCL